MKIYFRFRIIIINSLENVICARKWEDYYYRSLASYFIPHILYLICCNDYKLLIDETFLIFFLDLTIKCVSIILNDVLVLECMY